MTAEKYDLQDVLNALMLAEPEPSHEALLRWIRRYPKFSKELEDHFVAWSESELRKHLPDRPRSTRKPLPNAPSSERWQNSTAATAFVRDQQIGG